MCVCRCGCACACVCMCSNFVFILYSFKLSNKTLASQIKKKKSKIISSPYVISSICFSSSFHFRCYSSTTATVLLMLLWGCHISCGGTCLTCSRPPVCCRHSLCRLSHLSHPPSKNFNLCPLSLFPHDYLSLPACSTLTVRLGWGVDTSHTEHACACLCMSATYI